MNKQPVHVWAVTSPDTLEAIKGATRSNYGAPLLLVVDTAVAMNAAGDHHGTPIPDCVDENVSTKVVKIIQSYTGIVNKMVWRKF